ncbi:hypothetical protein MLD38_032410 [Melastoma candidum]|uniref:Uncharacterized protein n=1 Tax=Melastoma candidum TaxID=119954 RepID=A0ACB9M7T6_9MYRT|nr:hypothetical protein MLD38_032410 [Melastoma candidum]
MKNPLIPLPGRRSWATATFRGLSVSPAADPRSSSPASPVDDLYNLITAASSPQDLRTTLRSSNIPLTNEVIDGVLRRVRFGHSNPLQALELFRFCCSLRGFYPSAYSLDTLLYVLGRSRKFDLVWEVLYDVRRKDRGFVRYKDRYMRNDEDSRDFGEEEEFVDVSDQGESIISMRTVMVVLGRVAKVCSVRQTVESLRRLRRIVRVFDVECFNALLRTLCQEKSMADARNVYHALKKDFRPNLRTFNVLLSGWKSVEDAEGFFDEMRDMGVKPDAVSYNCLIDVYCKDRSVEKAMKVVEKMREEGISPDVYSYTSLIGGLGLIGQPDKARDILKEMKEYGCYPDVAAYNAAVRNYCIAKRMGDAYKLMDEMTEKGLSPNATTYNLFFRVFYWSNDLRRACELYVRMIDAGCLPNTQSCLFLIKLFKRQEQVAFALKLWNDMVEKGFGSYTLVSDILIDLLCDHGKLQEAERCFLQMTEKGQKPSNVSFRRIKALMELTNREDNLKNLSLKMAAFEI